MYPYSSEKKNYRRFGIVLFLIGSALLFSIIATGVMGTYEYQKDYSSSWKLAYKASTIEQKLVYIDKYVTALENGGFEGKHEAIFFKTPDNSFDKNLEAIKSLQTRLSEIQEMDPTTFEYNTAIYQITQQEQMEGKTLNETFAGIWWLDNYMLLWDWICTWVTIGILAIMFFGVRYWNYGNWD